MTYLKKGTWSRSLTTIAVLLVLGTLLSACGGGDKEVAAIVVVAFADQPVAGATVQVYDAGGKALKTTVQPVPSGEADGVYIVEVEELPADFRVESSNGSIGGRVFSGVLVSHVQGFDPPGDAVYLNPVTTLASAYMDRNPQMSVEEANAAVKEFLEIPEEVDVADLGGLSPYFGTEVFMAEALKEGGLDGYVARLADQVGSGETRSFPAVAESFSQTDLLRLLRDRCGSKPPCDLTEANLNDYKLTNFKLNDADLRNAKLHRTDLTGAKLTGANLTGAELKGTKLINADLTGAELKGANLHSIMYFGVVITIMAVRTDLTGADLTGAKLIEADLRFADLRNAILIRADLTRAKLHGADFRGAKTEGCIGCP